MKQKRRIKLPEYRLDFMTAPLACLSALSVIIYAAELLGLENAQKIYTVIYIFTVICALFMNINNKKRLKILGSLVLTAVIFYVCFYESLIASFAQIARGGGIKFGMINTALNTFALYDLQFLADKTSYGGSYFHNGSIVNGAVNCFIAGCGSEVSRFLSARFIVISSLIGIFVAVRSKDKRAYLILLFSVLSGNCSASLLFLLLVHPLYYLLLLLMSCGAYFATAALGINFGFYHNPSIFELFYLNDNRIYALVVCVFVISLSYYISVLVKEKL